MRALIGILLFLVVASCGGGGGGTPDGTPRPPPPLPPLTFSGSVPASGASAAIRPVTPVLTFSAALNAATVNSSNVSLRSIAGNHAPIAITFTAVDGEWKGSGWTGPTVVPNDHPTPAFAPQVAIDASGNALCVAEKNGARADV